MESLRKPFFFGAAVLILLVVLIELGANGLLQGASATSAQFTQVIQATPELNAAADQIPDDRLRQLNNPARPGIAIRDMAFLDGLVLLAAALMGLPFLISYRVQGRIQGILTLLVSLAIIIGAFVLIWTTLAKLLLMVALFLAPPFGTIAYLAQWGFFNRGGAMATLSLLMLLKLGFGTLLLLAHQGFLKNKGLVLILLTSIVANVVISFLHGLVPIFLVSITDHIAAIIMLVLALVWALVYLIGSVIATVKAVGV